MNCVMKRKAEYRAVTIRSDCECVVAPWSEAIQLRVLRGQRARGSEGTQWDEPDDHWEDHLQQERQDGRDDTCTSAHHDHQCAVSKDVYRERERRQRTDERREQPGVVVDPVVDEADVRGPALARASGRPRA